MKKRQLKNYQEVSLTLKRQKDLAKYETLCFYSNPFPFYCTVFQYELMFDFISIFEHYKARLLSLVSRFVGLKHFKDYYFSEMLTNGINISEYVTDYGLVRAKKFQENGKMMEEVVRSYGLCNLRVSTLLRQYKSSIAIGNQ